MMCPKYFTDFCKNVHLANLTFSPPFLNKSNTESVMQRFYIVPQLTETCILGIDFIANNSMVIDGENRRVTCKINEEQFSFIGEPKLSDYNCSALIQIK